eukprot:Ihof_evm2s893 gene=Ihof_evmTU2s893
MQSNFFSILNADINFFKKNNLMDYSFLIGVSEPPPEGAELERPDWSTVIEGGSERVELYYVGFIDCLTSYSFKKKTAHMFKTALWSPDTLSTIDATSYAERIKKYLFELFNDSSPSPISGHPRPMSDLCITPSESILLVKKAEILENTVITLETELRSLEDCLSRLLKLWGEP